MSRDSRMRRMSSLCLAVILLGSTWLWTHEGYAQPAPTPVTTDPIIVRSVSNESMELVLKYDGTVSPARLEIYVSDFATNAPVSGAQLALRTTNPPSISSTATERRPGIYEATLAFPRPGDYTLVIAVTGTVAGEFALTKLPLGKTPVASQVKPAPSWRSAAIPVGIGVVLVALALWIARGRRTRIRSRQAQIAALLLAALAWGHKDAIAHAGHGAGPAVRGPGPRYVAKESQFLLGVHTSQLKLEQLRNQLTVVGHVAPGAGAWTTIAAPQSGRFEGVGRPLAVGDRVQRGQLLGYLQVIDRLPVRAPISGLIADVEATPGQWVQAGQPLMRVLDPAHVRVEVPLFGENLTRGLAARTATVSLSAIPGRYFSARVRGLAPTVSTQRPDQSEPAGGSAAASPIAPLLLDITNTGGLLRPGMLVEVSLESAVSQPVMAVPQSAIIYVETGPGVFVHTAPERFELRMVALGSKYRDKVAISGDLKPGDRVVTQAAYSLVAAPPDTTRVAGAPR